MHIDFINGHEIRSGINGSGHEIFLTFAPCGHINRFTTEAEARHWIKWAY